MRYVSRRFLTASSIGGQGVGLQAEEDLDKIVSRMQITGIGVYHAQVKAGAFCADSGHRPVDSDEIAMPSLICFSNSASCRPRRAV